MIYSELSDFKPVIEDLANKLLAQEAHALLLLSGDLGAGKTTFTSQLGNYFHLKEISSPTFALHHFYESKEIELHHWDLYRLENQDDLESSGFWDQFTYEEESQSTKKSLIIVEWPERLNLEDLPLHWPQLKITIHINPNQTRQVEIQWLNKGNLHI